MKEHLLGFVLEAETISATTAEDKDNKDYAATAVIATAHTTISSS
jgi:hypothetical protein